MNPTGELELQLDQVPKILAQCDRAYEMQKPDEEANGLVTEMLQTLMTFQVRNFREVYLRQDILCHGTEPTAAFPLFLVQERARLKDPTKAVARRRVVFGLREVSTSAAFSDQFLVR